MTPIVGRRSVLVVACTAAVTLAAWRLAPLVRRDACLDRGGRWRADSCETISGAPAISTDTLGCREAARAAVVTWFRAIETGDTAAVRRAVSPSFGVISAGRRGWPEPFFRAEQMSELFAYVRHRARQRERVSEIVVPTGVWLNGRLGLGAVAYVRTADDVQGREVWLGKGEYECGRGIYILNTAPQGRRRAPRYRDHQPDVTVVATRFTSHSTIASNLS